MNASILLVEEVPLRDPTTGKIELGCYHNGIFVVETYPVWIHAGIVVEIFYAADEDGQHEIEIYGVLDGDESQEHPLGPPVTRDIPPCGDDFWPGTLWVEGFPLDASVEGNVDMIVRLDVDRITCAQTRICVRLSGLADVPLTDPHDLR
jgi:hypothetical protein